MRLPWIVILVLCLLTLHEASASQRSTAAYEYSYRNNDGAWLSREGGKDIADVQVTDSAIAGVATGADPYLPLVTGLKIDASALHYAVVRMRVTASHPGARFQLFMNIGTGVEPLHATGVLINDGRFHDYIVDLAAVPGLREAGIIANFRLDPIDPAATGDTFSIEHVRFYSDSDDLSEVESLYRRQGDGSRIVIGADRIDDAEVNGDGRLDEAVWRSTAGWNGGFVRSICEPHEVTTLEQGQTRFKVVEDSQNVYIAVVCDSIDPQAMDRTVHPHNSLALFNQEAIEIFIAAEREPQLVYQLGVNPSGSYAELMDGSPCFATAGVYTHMTETGYQAEIVLEKKRFAQLYKEANRQLFTDIWTINVARTQTSPDADARYSSWIYTGRQFNERAALGILRFGTASQGLVMLGRQYVDELTIRLDAIGEEAANPADNRTYQLRRQVTDTITEIRQAAEQADNAETIPEIEFVALRQWMIDRYAAATVLVSQLQAIAFSFDGAVDADYYWYMPPLTERPNDDRLPGRHELVDSVHVRLAGDEKAARRFSIHARNELKNVALTWGDLVNAEGDSISRDSVDVRILYRWSERGDADLLATDLRIALEGWLENYASAERFLPIIAANTSKHFIVSIKAQPGQAPGIYSGIIRLNADGNEVIELPIQADALPFDLLPTSRRVGFWYNGALPGEKAHSYHAYSGQTTERSMLLELQSMREDGFNEVDLLNYVNGPFNPDYTRKILGIAKSAGFERVTLAGAEHFIGSEGCRNALPETDEERQALQDARQKLAEHLRAIAAIAKEIGITVRIFGFDEPRDDNMFKVSEIIFEEAHRVGLKTVLAVLYHHEAHKVPNLDELLLVSQFNTDEKSLQWIAENRNKYDLVGYYPNYTADGTAELRLMYGWFLFRSGADASMSWAYYSIARDPFHIRPPGFHQAGYYAIPTRDEPIPTLKYEAVREGVNDLRYLETLEHALAQCSDPSVKSKMEAKLAALLDTFEPANNAGIQSRNYFTPHATYEKLRGQLQDMLLEVLRKP